MDAILFLTLCWLVGGFMLALGRVIGSARYLVGMQRIFEPTQFLLKQSWEQK